MGGGSALANAFAPSCVTGPTPWQPAVLPFQNPWPAAIACAAALPTPSWAAALRPAIAPVTPGAGAMMGGGSTLARAFAPSGVSCLPPPLPPPPALPSASASLAACPSAVPKACGDLADGAPRMANAKGFESNNHVLLMMPQPRVVHSMTWTCQLKTLMPRGRFTSSHLRTPLAKIWTRLTSIPDSK